MISSTALTRCAGPASRHAYLCAACRPYLRPRRLLSDIPGIGKGCPRGEAADVLVVIAAISGLFLAHIAEAAMWAAFFWKSGHLPSFSDGWYFAGVSHTRLGYGDVVFPKPWRSLGPICAISDLLHSGEFPLQFLDGVLNLLDSPGKLSRITSITTLGTGITIRFEPADVLFALVTALRTGNLDSFFLEHGDLSFTRS